VGAGQNRPMLKTELAGASLLAVAPPPRARTPVPARVPW